MEGHYKEMTGLYPWGFRLEIGKNAFGYYICPEHREKLAARGFRMCLLENKEGENVRVVYLRIEGGEIIFCPVCGAIVGGHWCGKDLGYEARANLRRQGWQAAYRHIIECLEEPAGEVGEVQLFY